MIFYKNLKKHKKLQEKDLVFSIFENGIVTNIDDSAAKPAECKNFYNLSYRDGALKTGLGFKDLQVPADTTNLENCHGFDFSVMDEIDGIWVGKILIDNEYSHHLLLIDSSFTIWQANLIDELEGIIYPRSFQLKSYPISYCNYRFDGEDANVFFSNEIMLYITGDFDDFVTKIPKMISCGVHYDKFFGVANTNRNKLIYTSDLNLKSWKDENASTIEFLDDRGTITKLITFNDYVYLFREYGITKVSLYGSKNDFSFTHLYTSTSKIFENSVCVCGDVVMFVTRDGLYAFNGNSVKKVDEDFCGLFENLDNSHCSSACLDGKYYLATNCSFHDEEKVGCESGEFVNNVLFQIDINDFSFDLLRGVDIRKVLSVDNPYMSKLCACFSGEYKQRIGELVTTGSTFESSNSKCWKSFQTDLDFTGKRKKVKEIFLTTLFDCEVVIESDENVLSLKFFGSAKEQRMPLNICGKTFQFSFKTDCEQCDIKKPKIVFDVEK